jgi:hypothetical protein
LNPEVIMRLEPESRAPESRAPESRDPAAVAAFVGRFLAAVGVIAPVEAHANFVFLSPADPADPAGGLVEVIRPAVLVGGREAIYIGRRSYRLFVPGPDGGYVRARGPGDRLIAKSSQLAWICHAACNQLVYERYRDAYRPRLQGHPGSPVGVQPTP